MPRRTWALWTAAVGAAPLSAFPRGWAGAAPAENNAELHSYYLPQSTLSLLAEAKWIISSWRYCCCCLTNLWLFFFFKKKQFRKWRITSACGQREQLKRGSPDYSCVTTAFKKEKTTHILVNKNYWFPLLVLRALFTYQGGGCGCSHQTICERAGQTRRRSHDPFTTRGCLNHSSHPAWPPSSTSLIHLYLFLFSWSSLRVLSHKAS